MPLKNETTTKYTKALEILNNMNNNKYTLKYIEENKLRNKNSENDFLNNNIHNRNYSPNNMNNNKNKTNNRSSSYLNKLNSNIKGDKNKNRSTKKNINPKVNINKEKEKIKENSINNNNNNNNNNNIHEYKINNLSSSYNNNFTNIKTNKIVFIDLKDNNNNFLKNNLNNDNPNEPKFNYNDRYTRNANQNANEEINNNNIIFRSTGSGNLNNKPQRVSKTANINSSMYNGKLNALNKKNIPEEKNILRNSRKGLVDNRNNNPAKINKNKFSNLTVQKLDQNKSDYTNKNYIVLEDNKREIIPSKKNQINLQDLKDKGLSYKECSFYILSKSPILRFRERMIFSRSSPALSKVLTKEIMMNDNQIILENKIEELEKKIGLCDKILDTPFTASKTADITLNFITSLQEIEFKEYPILIATDEEKQYYLNYIKILYHLLNEEIETKMTQNSLMDNNNMILNLRQNLYNKINNRGFITIKDILYNIYISNKDNIKEIPKIAEINYLVSQVNNMFEIHNSLKICKFISFTLYLVKEIVKYGNNIKSSVELKSKAKSLIDIINKKLNKYKSKYK